MEETPVEKFEKKQWRLLMDYEDKLIKLNDYVDGHKIAFDESQLDFKKQMLDFADQVTRTDFYVEFESFEDCFDKKFKL